MKWSLLLLLITNIAAQGQDVAWFNITQQEGLPSNTVYDMLQSRDGFLWLATENGLARYNGYRFRTYENPAVRSQSFSGLIEDDHGRIWLHNFFGEILYVENDTLKKLDSWEQYYENGFPAIKHFHDTLLINTPWHAYFYAIQSKTWTNIDSVFTDGSNASALRFGDVTVDHNGDVWICYANQTGWYVKNVRTRAKLSFQMKKEFNALASRLISWNGGVMIFDLFFHSAFELRNNLITQNNTFIDAYKPIRQVDCLGDSTLAIIKPDGLHLLLDKKWMKLLPGKNVSGVALDHEGGYWVSTLNEGIFYTPHLYSRLFAKERWALFTKIAIDEKRGFILAGGYDGSVTIFKATGEFVHAIKPVKNKEVQSLLVDSRNNKLLVFTDRLYVYNLNTFALVTNLPTFPIKKMIVVNDHYVMATSGGLFFMDSSLKNKNTLLSQQRIVTVAHDPASGLLWIGAQKGVYTYDFKTDKINLWTTDGGSPGVSRILIQSDRIILGTLTNGIYFLKNGKIEKKITTAEGLPSNRISALVEHNGSIWGGTEKEIFSIDTTTNTVSVLNHSKGLAALEVYDLAFLNNQLWVSHPRGLQHFTSLPKKNTQACVIHLQQASSDGALVPLEEGGITLQPSSHQLTLRFDVSNNLKSRGETRILYRMKELDHDNWRETSLASPQANYLSLPSGNFTFEVKAMNEDNIQSANTIAIPIYVLAPFYKRTWFLVLVLLAAIAGAIMITYWRFKLLHSRNQELLLQQNKEQQLRIAQLTSIRAQMNPHFIFNTMSSIQGKILNGHIQEANDSIQNFAQLLRRVLELSSNEMITLQEEIDILEKYLIIEKDRFDGSLEYNIVVDDAVRNEYLQIPSLLTQPFVENALRHGLMHKQGSKKLTVEFCLDKDTLVISIDDNGVGRAAAAEFNKARQKNHRSFAMDAYQKRIELLNAVNARKIELNILDKQNERGLALGTTVTIRLPLHDESA